MFPSSHPSVFTLTRFGFATALALVALAAPSLHAQFQGLGFLAGEPYSEAYAISGDGSTVVGTSFDENGDTRSFRWTAATGMVALPPINPEWTSGDAYAVSYDGSVIVGQDYPLDEDVIDGGTRQGYRWTAGATVFDPGTTVGTPYAPGATYSWGESTGVSADGSVVIGAEGGLGIPFRWTAAGGTVHLIPGPGEATGISADGSVVVGFEYGGTAFRWTEADGAVPIEVPGISLEPNAISADGTTIVGNYDGDNAFAWTESGGIQFLDTLPGSTETHALAVSGDGRWAVGHAGEYYGEIATLWDTTTGEVWDLNELFTTTFDFDLEGWTLRVATGISADGLTITGWGINPNGDAEAWIAHLGSIPEPATFAALAGAGALALAAGRRRRRA
jgi:probable HAF family extracellular repeat protein